MTAPALLRADIVCRSELRSSGRKLGGYAAVFEQTTDLGRAGLERIARGAFDPALSSPETDVRALWNHDPQYLLGRQSAGTLRLSADSTGLEYEVDLPDTGYARDLRALAERGDLDGASFGFVPGQVENRGGVMVHVAVARLVDVSPVTFPAYAGASTEARHLVPGTRRDSNLIRVRHRAARNTLGGVNR